MKHAGAKTDALVEFVDIYPTLSELAGFRSRATWRVRASGPCWTNEARVEAAAFSQYPRNVRASVDGYSMRTDRYRFTVWWTAMTLAGERDRTLRPSDRPDGEHQHRGVPANAALVERLMDQWRKGWQGARPGGARR